MCYLILFSKPCTLTLGSGTRAATTFKGFELLLEVQDEIFSFIDFLLDPFPSGSKYKRNQCCFHAVILMTYH